MKRILKAVLSKAIVSSLLREAVQAILDALQSNNYGLACELSTVKGLIIGIIDPKDKKHAFQEDEKENERRLGRSVYEILDRVNFELSMKLGRLPSGMMVVSGSSGGLVIQERREPVGEHPVIKRIRLEHNAIDGAVTAHS